MNDTLIDVRGVGPTTAKELAARGIRTVGDLASTPVAAISDIPGFGGARAAQVKAAAAELIRLGATSEKRSKKAAATVARPAAAASAKAANLLDEPPVKASIEVGEEKDEAEKTGKDKSRKVKKDKKKEKEKKGKKKGGKEKKSEKKNKKLKK